MMTAADPTSLTTPAAIRSRRSVLAKRGHLIEVGILAALVILFSILNPSSFPINRGAASSYGLGSDLLVPGIAAALAGGTAITGGSCNPINIVFGSLFIALIPVGTAAMGVSTQAQSIVYGLVLIVAVAATASRSRGGIVK